MNILVVGALGQLGRSLVERVRGLPDLHVDGLSRNQLDLTNVDAMQEVLGRHRADVIINAAAYTAVDKAEDDAEAAYRVNAQAAGQLALAAGIGGADFIQVSTDYVFDGSIDRPYSETDAANPINVYGRSKLQGEKLVLEANPAAIVVRTSWLYSPFGGNFVKTMLAVAHQRRSLTVVSDQTGNPTSALDLADGLLAAARSRAGRGKVYHLSGTGEASWAQLAMQVMQEAKHHGAPTADIVSISSSEWQTRAARPQHSALSCERFFSTFGHRMPLWTESLKPVVARLLNTSPTR
jgi:dTDP-4-dehydrorhamnose reductase